MQNLYIYIYIFLQKPHVLHTHIRFMDFSTVFLFKNAFFSNNGALQGECPSFFGGGEKTKTNEVLEVNDAQTGARVAWPVETPCWRNVGEKCWVTRGLLYNHIFIMI